MNKMGLFENLRKKEKMEKAVSEYFQVISGYTPSFSTFEGSIYEMELTRTAIHSFANHVSKLKPIVKGPGNAVIERKLQYRPNPLMDTKKYLYRLATVVSVENTALIAPLYNPRLEIVGFYPLTTTKCQQVNYEGETYIRYNFGNNSYGACELKNMGRMTQFQYKDELYGESNTCLSPTMNMIIANNEGIVEGIENGAAIRFLAKMAQTLRPKDLEEERERFKKMNLSKEKGGGVLLFDQKYAEIKQIESKPFIIDSKQMERIDENVFNYFGTNKKILQNSYNEEECDAYYEGKIEPFALEAGLVHTNMLFSEHEVAYGNEVIFTSNRLQNMSTKNKIEFVKLMQDRGNIDQNTALDVFGLPPVKDGDKRFIRGEYIDIGTLENTPTDTGGDLGE